MSAACRQARDDIECLLFEDGNQPFFPSDALRQYFEHFKIEEILLCKCSQCAQDLRLFGNRMDLRSIVYDIMGPPNDSRNSTRTRYSLFGLLVYAEHPIFIIGFLEAGCSDDFLESWVTHPSLFSRENLAQYTANYKSDQVRFGVFVKRFDANLPRFAVPRFETSGFRQYNPKVIFPFVGEKEIGKRTADDGHLTSEGANGRVFAFKIHHEYCRFPNMKPGVELARKQIQTPQPQAFLEKGNIQHVQKFHDPHIVKLIGAYGYGGSINLIFPKAWTNLDHLLRDRNFHYERKRNPKLELNNAWEQLLGISKALRKIQGFGRGADSRENVDDQLCIHFDLKPDNILIQKQDGNWIITDFGQAALAQQRRGGTTPRVGGHFGTDSYAPPEIEDANMASGRAYDIWSLGCIILEVTAFMVLGYAGLKGTQDFAGLDQARQATQSLTRIRDERFFYRESSTGEYVVKREILDFIESLKNRHARARDSSKESIAFLNTILDLVTRMLKPNVKDRVDISRVVAILSSAIKRASAGIKDDDSLQVIAADNEIALGGPQLNQIGLWRYSESNRAWQAAHLEALLNVAGYLRLHCWAAGHEPIDIIFRRNDAKILPIYAFWDSENMWGSKTWIDFSLLSADHVSVLPNAQFSFDGGTGLEEARIVQSKMTSQDIKGSFTLRSVKLNKPASIEDRVKAVKDFFRKSKSGEMAQSTDGSQKCTEFGSATVQIWVETEEVAVVRNSSRQSLTVPKQNKARPTREFAQEKLRPCRVVMYLHSQRFICTIKIDINWILEVSDSNKRILTFKPHPPGRKQVFYASWICPTQEELASGYPAGIPLNPTVLQYYEDLDCIEAENFELEFLSAQDLEDFEWKYLEVKKAWNTAREKLVNIIPTNRMLGNKPQLPDGVSGLPVPKKQARLRAFPRASLGLSSASSASEMNSRHDSTVEAMTPTAQDPTYLTVPGSGLS